MSHNSNGPLSARSTVTLGALTLIVLLGASGAWVVLANISGAIIASGRIEVAQNQQVVQHPDGAWSQASPSKRGLRSALAKSL